MKTVRIFFIWSAFLFPFPLLAQQSYTLELPTSVDFDASRGRFYIDSIIDGRAEATPLGELITDYKTSESRSVALKGELVPTLKSYLRTAFMPPSIKTVSHGLVMELKSMQLRQIGVNKNMGIYQPGVEAILNANSSCVVKKPSRQVG